MERTLSLITISAGLLLSIACATLIEELLIGGLFRIFFAPRGPQQRSQPCWGERPVDPQEQQAKPGHIISNGRGR